MPFLMFNNINFINNITHNNSNVNKISAINSDIWPWIY